MKAINFLNEILSNGWDNSMVQTVDGSRYGSATDLAEMHCGAKHVCLRTGFTYTPNATYGMVFLNADKYDIYEEFLHKADFIADLDLCDNIYFFRLS